MFDLIAIAGWMSARHVDPLAVQRAARRACTNSTRQARRRKACELRVRRPRNAREIRAVVDDGQAGVGVFTPVARQGLARDEAAQGGRHGLDGGEGAVELVTEHAHEALPGLAFFLAQRPAQL